MIQNARITSTTLGVEDHGIFSAWVHLDYGSGGQGFGGWTLDDVPLERRSGSERRGTAFGCDYVMGLLRVLEVGAWEKLPGTFVRAEIQDGLVVRLGHPLKDKWFDPKALAESHKLTK